MDAARDEKAAEGVALTQEPAVTSTESKSSETTATPKAGHQKKGHKGKKRHRKRKASKKVKEQDSSDSSDSDSTDSDDDESEDSSDEGEKRKHKSRSKRKKASKRKQKARKNKKSKKHDSSDSDADSDSESDSEDSEPVVRRQKKSRREVETESEDDESDGTPTVDIETQAAHLQQQLNALYLQLPQARSAGARNQVHIEDPSLTPSTGRRSRKSKKKGRKASKSRKRASMLEYKRVDQLWDSTIHNYKLTESAEGGEDEFEAYVFTVRRKFDWENKYRHTVVDIKSKPLREALAEVMKDVKGVSLVEEQPCVCDFLSQPRSCH